VRVLLLEGLSHPGEVLRAVARLLHEEVVDRDRLLAERGRRVAAARAAAGGEIEGSSGCSTDADELPAADRQFGLVAGLARVPRLAPKVRILSHAPLLTCT